MIAVFAATALIAGFVNGVTGFGLAIIMMMTLPYLFPIPQSAAISAAAGLSMNVYLAVRYRAGTNVKAAVVPAILCLAICSLAIKFSLAVDPSLLKRVFGVFFIILAVYFLLSKPKEYRAFSTPAKLAFIVLTGLCDGLFGIGGPPMVLYFLATTKSREEYMGTLQLFFLISATYNTCFRVANGILLPEHAPIVFAGMAIILIGTFLGSKVADRLDAQLVRKLIYVMIGICGITNLF